MNPQENEERLRVGFSQEMIVEDTGGNITVNFPDTKNFISEIKRKRNAQKLHQILKRKL
ncbi:MAG: hypothetical protein ACOC44_14915 [Promethearchaeia archaeon]